MARAGELRKNQTEAEAKLWARLRAHRVNGIQFRRHTAPGGRCRGHAIGDYIVDFCSPRRKVVIELDGSQHLKQTEYDLERTKYLDSLGYRVLRFWNHDVMNDIDTGMNVIWNGIDK
jgi:very-short-patch-repair endonuclease